ncbi:MAG: hypothetical protein XD76_1312 [candidate division TA06 bacterium 32_111]|uniref:Uncharacterized protein n=1 Tax=candidate division TA06 bacterium 34_109 TaxID=1635277 RepID=A0A117M6E6_UNCT6|nr:MAG: hypothetical protein XD76_1312 [candidate division TA06 bacterium 32_111]KUK86936.1 MAG: hypothetical protein XE03_1154 [candidate division TA06 bacterium 34_109]
MNMSRFLSLIFILPLFLFASYSVETDLNVENQEVLLLELSSSKIDLGEIKPDMKEVVKLKGITVKVKSNVKWVLTVEPLDNLVSTDGDVINIERLELRGKKGNFTPLSLANPITIASGDKTGDNGYDVDIDFRMKIRWDDPSGRYNTKLRFTLNSIY